MHRCRFPLCAPGRVSQGQAMDDTVSCVLATVRIGHDCVRIDTGGIHIENESRPWTMRCGVWSVEAQWTMATDPVRLRDSERQTQDMRLRNNLKPMIDISHHS